MVHFTSAFYTFPATALGTIAYLMAQNMEPVSIASNLGPAAPYVVTLGAAAFGIGIGIYLKEEVEKDHRKSRQHGRQGDRAY